MIGTPGNRISQQDPSRASRPHWRAVPGAWLAAWAIALAPAAARGDELGEHLQLLGQNGIKGEAAEVIAYLQRLQPDPAAQAAIAALVGQLSDAAFAQRSAAYKELATFGEAARAALAEASNSTDPEVRARSIALLRILDSGERAQLQQALTLAALEVLQSRRDPQATPVILATLGSVDDPYTRGAAAEALWASATPAQLDTLAAAMGHENLHIRAAAIVAFEIAGGDAAAQRLAPLLESDDPVIRLAAARALIDRQAQRAVPVLVAITAGDDLDLALQADALLRMKTAPGIQPDEDQPLDKAWQAWAAEHLAGAKLDQPLGERRLDLSAGRKSLLENFARDAASLATGYGLFQYEADKGGGAKVAGGQLHIDGNHPEGDQRLFITSRRMIGRDRWPDQLEVRAKLGGEAGNNFGWHLGVSVGKVKTLFHPGLAGGSFRAEATDSHRYIFANEKMSFEPVAGVIHEMIIRVKKTAIGADFDVTVNGGNGGAPHKKKFSVTEEQLGDYDRIGLERSGRTGGGALFDSLSIRLVP